jgi:excisionase family DNA binding protein
MEERYLSLAEAREVLGKTDRTLYRWIKSGKLKAYKPGRDYEIPESAIQEMRERSEVRPKAGSPLSAERALAIADPDDFRRVVKNTPTAALEQTALELAQLTKVPTREDLVGDKDNKEAHRRTMANYCIGAINVELDSRGVRSPVGHVAMRLNDALTPPEEQQEEERAG